MKDQDIQRKESGELPKISLAYLGPKGNFTHMAGIDYARNSVLSTQVQLVEARSLPEIFRMVEEGTVRRAIVPIENSSDGHIKVTLEALANHDFQIVDEGVVPVSLSFVMRKDAVPSEVHSKDTALRQAKKFLDRNYPHLKRVGIDSTGAAILKASMNPAIAAIGSKISAREQEISQDLLTQQDGIEDNPGNATRFVVITKEKKLTLVFPNAKTSFIMSVPDQPGHLFLCLAILKNRGIGLSQLKSFNGNKGHASFIVTVSGHQYEQNLSQALAELRLRTSLKMLGSYKRADYQPPEMDGQLSITDENITKLKEDLFVEKPPEEDETIVAFSLHDRLGVLGDAIEIFEKENINLTRIGSSPSTRGKLDEYIFYLGFRNNLSAEKKAKIMKELKSNSQQLVLVHSSERK